MSDPQDMIAIDCNINGRTISAVVPASRLLVDFLRDDLGLSGAKRSCDTQICGACTVIVDGRAVSSCTYLAFEANGLSVETVEGLARGSELHPLQQSFVDANALQCGFCTPGMLMSALALLRESPRPTDTEIRHYMSGNICRCTGYQPIVKAIQRAAP